MDTEQHYWAGRVSRRRFMGTAGVATAGLAAAALIGCSSSTGGSTSAPAGGSAAPAAKGPTADAILGKNWGNREGGVTPKYGGTLNWAYNAPALANLDPLTSTSAMVHIVGGEAYNQLMRTSRDPKDRNSALQYYPDIAESWETTDPLKMTFKIRQGVKWHNIAPVNGRAMTVEDVKYALNRCASDAVSLFKGNLSAIKSIETPDASTVVINLKKFDPILFGNLANQGPWITPKELADSGHMKDQMIGTGPFIFQKWEQDVRINFKKNPDYFVKGAPFVDELNVLQIKDENARVAALQSGQSAMGDIPFNSYDQFKANKDITIEPYLRVQPYVLFFNFKEARWKDDRVRQAVALAIDTDVMVKALVGQGLWRGIVSNQHGGWTLSQDELKSSKYFKKQDLAKAKQLMTAAGNPDGVANVELLYNTEYPQNYQDGMQYMAEILTKNKIAAIKPVGKDQATMRKQQDEHTYSGLVFGLDGQGYPELFLGDYKTGGPKNGSGLSDPQVDADVDSVLSIVDVKARQEATKKFIDKYLQRVMYKHEFVDGTFYEGWNKSVHNYVPFPPFQYTSAHPFVWLGDA